MGKKTIFTPPLFVPLGTTYGYATRISNYPIIHTISTNHYLINLILIKYFSLILLKYIIYPQMKIKTTLTALLILTSITTFSQSTALSKAIQKTMPAVFVIKTYDGQGSPLGLGTGFFIDSTGTGITNYHVLAGASTAEIFLQDDRNYKIAYTDGEDNAHDIIRFHIAKSNNNNPKFKFLKISGKQPQIGEDCFTIGNPNGLVFTASNGIVSSVRDDDEIGLVIKQQLLFHMALLAALF